MIRLTLGAENSLIAIASIFTFEFCAGGRQCYKKAAGVGNMVKHNRLAIVVAVILHQVIGFLWYSDFLFVNQWMAGLGKKAGDFDMANPAPFVADIVGWFFACYFISWLVQRTQIESFNQAVGLAVLLWVGLALPVLAPHYLFAGLHINVLLIDAMNALAQLAASCALLALWRKR